MKLRYIMSFAAVLCAMSAFAGCRGGRCCGKRSRVKQHIAQVAVHKSTQVKRCARCVGGSCRLKR